MAGRNIHIAVDRVSDAVCPHCRAGIDVTDCEPLQSVECPSCGRTMTVPARLGSFILLETLGQGGMGTVYKALDTSLNRQVAIKVMRQALGRDRQFSADLAREARAAAALNHPHVAQIHSFGEEKGQPYIVMELASGGRLDQMIRTEGPLAEARVLDMAIQVAEGLHAAQEAGLIHADIKPANIVFDQKGSAKLVDFGLALSAEHAIEGGESWGTPYYVAPEQVSKKKIDHRADIYSLGATLFHALTGRHPFSGETPMDVVNARVGSPPPDLREANPGVSEATGRVITRMLAEARSERYPTYASLLADLRAARGSLAEDSPKPLRATSRKNGRPAWPMIRAIVLSVFGVVAVTLVVVLARMPRQHPAAIGPLRTDAPEFIPKPSAIAGEEVGVDDPEAALAGAVKYLASGKSFAAAEELQGLSGRLGPDDPLYGWIGLLQAFSAWSDNLDTGIGVYLEEIAEGPKGAPAALARFMLGRWTVDKLRTAAEGWAPGDRALAEWVVGLDELRKGEDDAAVGTLEGYLAMDPSGPAWSVGLRPLAEQWIAQQAECERVRAEAASLPADRKRETLADLKSRVSPVFHEAIDADLDEAARQRAVEEQKRQAATEERDRERLAAIEDNVDGLADAKAYEQALSSLEKARETLETDQGRAQLDGILDTCRRLNEVKTFLVERLNEDPPKGFSPGLRGRATGADVDAVHVTTDRGPQSMPWSEVTTRTYLSMFDYYMNRTDRPHADKADLYLSAAVFCNREGGPKQVLAYTSKAVELHPAIEDEARRLLPDVKGSHER